MYDIHMHLLPGLDDGAATPEMSLDMIRRAKTEGIRAIVATPHSGCATPEETAQAFTLLTDAMKKAGMEMPIYLGCEVHCSPRYMDPVLHQLRTGGYATLNGTKFVLTEFSPHILPEDAALCLDRLLSEGWRPVIAHAERYRYLTANEDFYPRWHDRGCLIQCNAYSFAQESNPLILAAARSLLRQGLVDFLGTDAHRSGHRPPQAATGLAWIREHTTGDYFLRITEENPRTILNMK